MRRRILGKCGSRPGLQATSRKAESGVILYSPDQNQSVTFPCFTYNRQYFTSSVLRWVLIRDRLQYSLNKYGLMMGSREKGWEEHTVASLDSALNNWFDSLPDHRGSTLYSLPLTAYSFLASALGTPTRESNVLYPVGGTARCLLLHSNHDPSAVHTYCPQGEFFVFLRVRDLCECCPCFQPRCRRSPEAVPVRYNAKYYCAFILVG